MSRPAGPETDEFQMLEDNATEAGLAWTGRPEVRRVAVDVGGGREVSALVWGRRPPELVLLHGGGQNAHTWDTVALALGRPLVALDLPGHGHSGWREDEDYRPEALAGDVASALRRLAPAGGVVVGMSLGGLVALALTPLHPGLVRRLVLVDITPGTDGAKAEPILAFLAGPERFGSFQEMLDRAVAFNPSRSVSSLRRGVAHNAREFADGTWGWRWDPALAGRRGRRPDVGQLGFGSRSLESLWPAVDAVAVPLLLVRGARSEVVSAEDAAELVRRQPDARIEVVRDAGHSVQGDQPRDLARQLAEFVDAGAGR